MRTRLAVPLRDEIVVAMPSEVLRASRRMPFPVPVLGTRHYVCGGKVIHHEEVHGRDDPIFGMAGFATYDDIISALSTSGRGQYVDWNKTSLGATVAASAYDLWQAAGTPPAGTFGVALTGRAIDNTFAAALPLTSATGGRFLHALSLGAGSTVTLGTLLLYDRLAEYPFTGTTTGAQNYGTVPALPARDLAGATAGAGVMMMLETFSATTRGVTNVTVTYTNSAGTGARSTVFASTAGTAIAGGLSNPTGAPFVIPLQSGDVGVRSIQTVNATASLLAANMCLTLFRPIAMVPVLAPNSYVERDLVLQLANLPRLYDGSALGFMLLSNTTTSPCFGRAVYAEN